MDKDTYVKNRLFELGYYRMSDNEELFRIALTRYQYASGLTATGTIDDEIIKKLFGGKENK